jgi:hypothetical protein
MRRPHTQGARQQPAVNRRSGQVSRGLVGRWAVKTVGGHVVKNRMQRPDRVAHRHSRGQGGAGLSILQKAHRDERTVLAIFALLFVRTAGHVSRHRRHAGCRRLISGCGSRHGCNRETGGHQGRENQIEEPAKVHIPSSHGFRSFGRPSASRVRQFRSSRLGAARSGAGNPGSLRLDGRARHRPIAAEHATIPRFRLQPYVTALAVIEELTCVLVHDLRVPMAAMRAG